MSDAGVNSSMQVKDVMTRDVVVVAPDIVMSDAITQMTNTRSSCLIIVEQHMPVGIMTERDVVLEFSAILADFNFSKRCVSEVMTKEPVCVDQNCDFNEALVLSRSRNLRHLPVVDNTGKLVGLVTQTNLVNAYANLVDRHDELVSDFEELKLLSLEDPLTKIGNRRAMEVDLAYTEAESKRHSKTYAIALIDIDLFKKYNDHYGHQQGDEALKSVAAAIKDTVRDSDRVFRYGGEELLVLMPETNFEAAAKCAERVRAAVERLEIEHMDSHHSVLTVSIGVSSDTQAHWKALVETADKRLYEAKANGRNQAVTKACHS